MPFQHFACFTVPDSAGRSRPSDRRVLRRCLSAAMILSLLVLPGCEESGRSGTAAGDAGSGAAASPAGDTATAETADAANAAGGSSDAADPPAGTDPDDPMLAVLTELPPTSAIEPGPPPALSRALTPLFRLIGDGRPDVARVRLRKHLALEPDDGVAHFLFGLTYHRERQYSEAIPWFADAIRLTPSYGPSLYFAAWGRFYLGELELAERLWQRHLAHEPDAADTHFGLGLVDLERGRPDAAAARFRRAIAIEEHVPGRERSVAKAWARLGDALADMDQTADARAALEQAVALWPDHHEAWARLGRLLRRLGDADAAAEAEAQASEALERTRAADGRRP